MVPPGTKFLIHETPQQLRTLDFHGKEVWYIATAPLHYKCYLIFIPETQVERIIKTVQFFPHNGAMPAMSFADAATEAAWRLADALANPALAASFARFGTQTIDAIRQLANIFAATGAPPIPPQPTRHTRTPMQLPRCQHSTDRHAPPRVLTAVPLSIPPRLPPDPPPRVDPPTHDPPHRYSLHSCAQTNHTVETIGEGAVAFQGVLDPTTEKTQGYTQLIRGHNKDT